MAHHTGSLSVTCHMVSPCKLENSSLGERSAGTNIHISWVLNCSNSSGSQNNLLMSLLQVDDVGSIISLLEDVLLHGGLAVAGAQVGGSSQHLGDIIFLYN